MIFLRRETFKGYIKSYPGIVTIAALCVLVYLLMFIEEQFTDTVFILISGMMVGVPDFDPFGLQQPWRYVTSMFLHADFYHLFHNMFMLIVFAPPLERLMKTKRFVPFYLLSGVGGNFLAVLISSMQGETHLGLGASGAVYGVLGAYLFMALFRQKMLDAQSKQTIYMILGIGIVTSLIVDNISLWGHVGGLLTGLLLYRLFDRIMTRKN